MGTEFSLESSGNTGVTTASPTVSDSGNTGVTADSPTAASGNTGVTATSPTADTDNNATAHERTVSFERFAEANRKAKQAEESAQRWQQIQQQYGELADPQTYKAAVNLFSQLRQDPATFATQLLSELAANEQYRPAIASQAAKVLQGLRGSAPKEDPEPQPDLVAENGAPVFSAQQMRAWQDWQVRHIRQEFQGQIAEATKPLKEYQHERAVAQVRQHAEQTASHMYDRAKSWHGFTQHEADIASVWREHQDWSLQDAYLHVLHTKILPTLDADAQGRVVADLKQKAAAQTLNPTGAQKLATPDFKGDFSAALKWASSR